MDDTYSLGGYISLIGHPPVSEGLSGDMLSLSGRNLVDVYYCYKMIL